MSSLSELYDRDYAAWAGQTSELLRHGRFDELDIGHLLEELSDMGKSDQRELENRLTILLAHLLKWQYQLPALTAQWREFDGRSWRATIIEQRDRIHKRLAQAPGLQAMLAQTIAEAYADARRLASKETLLPLANFPAACPYLADEILDETFYPIAGDPL